MEVKEEQLKQLHEIENFLHSLGGLPQSIKIDDNVIVMDLNRFLAVHFNYCLHNAGKRTFIPYYERLINVCIKLGYGSSKS